MSFLNYLFRALLFLTIVCGQLNAGLSPLAFKNVNKCFKPGFEYCSPCFGCAALESGLIENLRFFNVNAAFDANGKREYIKDTPLPNDPFMNIIKILFPSPIGQLTSETSHPENLGKHSTVKNIADLINFAHFVRKIKRAIPTKNQIDTFQVLKEEFEKFKEKDDKGEFTVEIFFQNLVDAHTGIKNLLVNIIQAIVKEKRDWPTKKKASSKKGVVKKSIEPSYPKNFVEQIINSFFCHKFGDQKSIKELLKNLDSEIVYNSQLDDHGKKVLDTSRIDLINDLLTKDDIQPVLEKLRSDTADFDDIWALVNIDVFDRIIPYKSGHEPISSGNTQLYNRATKKRSDENKHFADCVEVTLRHISNFLLYDPLTNRFNLSYLPKDASDLKKFYTLQTPDQANAGGPEMRSAWNEVVADRGAPIVYKRTFDEKDGVKTNEIRSGMFNIITVLSKVFNANSII